ncbi:MAG TPA: cupin domain-containing protein [Methanothrix soehngenii]|jgi:quercetin dioxygenase-like cupin family protein|nr:cupin domain-containing protein [Methanothrix soehngenii]
MKKIFVALFMAFLCACVLASAEEMSFLSANLTDGTVIGGQVNLNQSEFQPVQVNLIDLAQQNAVGTNAGLNITQVASGKNASVNLVLGPPGSILKMHYHRYRDEIVYCIKGQAVMNVSGKESEMKTGDMMYIPALLIHGSEVTGNETLQLISIFAPPFDGKDRIYV